MISILVSLILIRLLLNVFPDGYTAVEKNAGEYNEIIKTRRKRIIGPELIVANATVKVGSDFNPHCIVDAYSHIVECNGNCERKCEGLDISDSVLIREIEGNRLREEDGKYVFDTNKPGKSVLEFIVKDKRGVTSKKRIIVLVDNDGNIF